MKKSQALTDMTQTRSSMLRQRSELPSGPLRLITSEASKQADIAMYYGFTPIKPPIPAKEDLVKAKMLLSPELKRAALKEPAEESQVRPFLYPEEKISLLRTCIENDAIAREMPIMLHYSRTGQGRKPSRTVEFGLDIIGTTKPIAEALVIQAACAILADEGYGQLSVEMNSIGDRDSIARHERELCNYFRRHGMALPPKLRSAFKCNVFDILSMNDPECMDFKENAPKPVSYLNEAGRRHFMEVLEHLETLGVPYRLNHSLIGHRGIVSHSVFEIREESTGTSLGYGFRYNQLSRKIGLKREVPAVGIIVSYKKSDAKSEWKPMTSPRFYFIQFGNLARLKSLAIIEMLRRERISVHHSLTKDKLVGQITAAESMNVPYVLIMGQKEAIEQSIVVRNMSTREQDTVAISSLASYLRRLK